METLKEPITQPPVSFPPTEPKRKNSFLYLIIGLLCLLLIVTSYFTYQFLMTSTNLVKTPEVVDQTDGVYEPEPIPGENPNSKFMDKLVYTVVPNPDAYSYQNEVWLMNSDGTEREKTQFKDVGVVFKFPGSSKMVYTSEEDSVRYTLINLYDFETKVTDTMVVPIHPDPEAYAHIQLGDIRYVAPDYSAYVVDIMYTVECPGSHFDGGPCQPDPVSGYEDGTYIYNVRTKELISFPEEGSVFISRWDPTNTTLYYIFDSYTDSTTATTLRKINYSTKQSEVIRSLKGEFDMIYPLFRSDKYVVMHGDTGGESDGTSTVSILDNRTSNEVFLDNGIWAEIQPFLSISPTEEFALYERVKWIDGIGYSSIHKLDLKSNKISRLTPDSNDTTYEPFGYWIDSDNFVTIEDTQPLSSEYNNYTVPDNYIININVRTGEITRLTDGTVSIF